MKVAAYNYLGPPATPHDLKEMRALNFESHRYYGMPIAHKHKWNEKDIREGKARYCPVDHDAVYPQGRSWCPYCYGTGYLGGYDDAVLVWVTLTDVQEDVIRFTPAGQVEHSRIPGLTAPWTPRMGDGDLIVTGDFNANNNITTERDRYELREVTQHTLRGYQREVQTQEFVFGQEAMTEFLPYDHPLYRVPIEMDPNLTPPDEYDSSLYPPGTKYSATSRSIFIVGQAYKATSFTDINLRITPVGTGTSRDIGLMMIGAGSTHSYI